MERTRDVLPRCSGTADLLVPGRDPNSVVKVRGLLARLDKPALSGAGRTEEDDDPALESAPIMAAVGEPLAVQARLKEIYHDLPEAMRRIADALMSDPLLGALWGIESMAERANVSIGTVVRFSKRLGYKGFTEFRDALREACQLRSEGDPLEALEAPTDPFWALAEVTRRGQDDLNRLLQTLDHATLESATQLLMRSQHRVLLGRGVSHVMCQVLAFNLTQAGLPCIAAIPSDFSNQVANLGPRDVLVVVSCAPFSRETVDAAAFAKRCGIPVLAFTDRKDSPLGKCATAVITLPSEDFLFSFGLSTFAVLSHALAIAVASKDSAGTVRRLKAADEVAQPLFVEHWLPFQPGAIRVARPPKPKLT